MLKRGADVNATYANRDPLLMGAVREKNVEIVKVLVDAGANVNARILEEAYSKGVSEIVEVLLAAGATE